MYHGNGRENIVQAGAALEIGNTNTSQAQGLMGGLGIWGEHLVLNGQGNSLFGDGALTILSSNSPTKNLVNDPVFAGGVFNIQLMVDEADLARVRDILSEAGEAEAG